MKLVSAAWLGSQERWQGIQGVPLVPGPEIFGGPAFLKMLLLLLVTQPLSRDGGITGDHGAPEAGQLPKVLTRGRRETESRQRVSGAKRP